MSKKRLSMLVLAFTLALPPLSCKDRSGLVSPVDPQFARPAKTAPAEPKLEEFWVYRDSNSDCEGEIIHVVVSGAFQYIGTSVAHDHFFNGVRDTGFHFEYWFRGPEYLPTDWNLNGTEGHADVCFLGEQIDHIYGDGSGGLNYFVDFPSTSFQGTGADPFAITVAAVIDGDGPHFESKVFRPTGVVEKGETGAPETSGVTSSWHPGHGFGEVRSYAVWNSPSPAGYLFFDGLTISNASCQVSTAIVGKAKNKTEVTTTTVTADVDFDYGAENLPGTGLTWDQDYWGEGHLRVFPDGGSAAMTSDGLGTPRQDGTATFTWAIDADLSNQEVEIEFLADFLLARTAASMWEEGNIFDYVYDPGRNKPALGTTAGFDGDPWDEVEYVSSQIGDGFFPVAHSDRVSVTCGGG